jgi:RHS repeat-associated protein
LTGHLVGEYNGAGQPVQEFVWLDQMPVALIDYGGGAPRLYHILADHLNTPRELVDEANRSVWRWEGEPFGVSAPQDDADGDGIRLSFNLRLPGQYFDADTSRHYNYFRDYDPATGRYVQSDPNGLAGGINLYAYVNGNPISFSDPEGLQGRAAYQPGGPGANLRWPSLGPSPVQVVGPYSTTTQGGVNQISANRGRLTEYPGNLLEFFGRNANGPINMSTTRAGNLRFDTTLPNGTRLQYREGPNGPRVDIYPPGGTPETMHPVGGWCP